MITNLNLPNAAFRPFSPRLVDVRYVAWPAGPKVFLSGQDIGSGQSGNFCGPDYPYDPRDLSLTGVYWNVGRIYEFSCPNGDVRVPIMEKTFYSTVSQYEADLLACQLAEAKAHAQGYTCATCDPGIMSFASGERMVYASGEPMTYAP